MIVFPGCKINLGLYVTEKRSDGYHNLETCFYAVPWNDILEAVPSAQYQLDITGIELPAGGENLCTRAFNLLKDQYNIDPVHAHLHKILPHGAGLGGGSSDGASMLLLLDKLFKLDLPLNILESLAGQLGSDCPFFINPSPKIATGRGEIFSSVNLSLKGKYIFIIKPPQSVSTAEAYRHIKIAQPEILVKDVLEKYPLNEWKNLLFNVFEDYAFSKIPELLQIKNLLYKNGASYALMSGSGSAVFGIFEEKPDITGIPTSYMIWSGQLD